MCFNLKNDNQHKFEKKLEILKYLSLKNWATTYISINFINKLRTKKFCLFKIKNKNCLWQTLFQLDDVRLMCKYVTQNSTCLTSDEGQLGKIKSARFYDAIQEIKIIRSLSRSNICGVNPGLICETNAQK